jgi:hypothetical protein
MKNLIALIVALSAVNAMATNRGIDAKAIYNALTVTAVEGIQDGTGYKVLSKSIPGFIDCRSTLLGWDVYHCSFGGHEGFSLEDTAYDSLNVPEKFLRMDKLGKWFEKSVGGMTCTKLKLKTSTGGDAPIYQKTKCVVTLSFGQGL